MAGPVVPLSPTNGGGSIGHDVWYSVERPITIPTSRPIKVAMAMLSQLSIWKPQNQECSADNEHRAEVGFNERVEQSFILAFSAWSPSENTVIDKMMPTAAINMGATTASKLHVDIARESYKRRQRAAVAESSAIVTHQGQRRAGHITTLFHPHIDTAVVADFGVVFGNSCYSTLPTRSAPTSAFVYIPSAHTSKQRLRAGTHSER